MKARLHAIDPNNDATILMRDVEVPEPPISRIAFVYDSDGKVVVIPEGFPERPDVVRHLAELDGEIDGIPVYGEREPVE
jgi:hypothetical protein